MFGDNKIFILSVCAIIAAIPVAIWVALFFKQANISKVTLAFLFFIGILTAPALLGIQYLWEVYPTFNVASLIETSISQITLRYAILLIFFGMMEEVIKHFAVRIIDKRTLAIKTVNDALRLSILSALGFSFAENIYYLFQLWSNLSAGQLIGVYISRSGLTMCAHMIFSGIFGYYFGISKFSIDISREDKLAGKEKWSSRVLARLFNKPMAAIYREKTILKGLFIAIFLHASFNFLLQLSELTPYLPSFLQPVVKFNIIINILFVVCGYLYLRFLLKRKAGHLVLLTDVSEKKKSMFAKRDEDVVVELLGMWFKEKRYVDVVHICERLLQRDPDNNVVKLFKAEAMDRMEGESVYKRIFNAIFKEKNEVTLNDKSVINKYVENKNSPS